VEATGLRADDFYRGSHGVLCEAALRVAAGGEPTDVLVDANELRGLGRLDEIGGPARLHELAALVPATANAASFPGRK
jgi:replicative DNA helicase